MPKDKSPASSAASDVPSVLAPGPSAQEFSFNRSSPPLSSDGSASGSTSRAYPGMHPVAPSSAFFSSASNIGIDGGQFSIDSSSYRNNTNLTINLHHGPTADNISVHENPSDQMTGANPSSLPGFSQYAHHYPYAGLPYYHTPSPRESLIATGHLFPSTSHIRHGFNPTPSYDAASDWLTGDFFTLQDTNTINRVQSIGSGISSLEIPVGSGSGFQHIVVPPLSQSSSSLTTGLSEQMVASQEDCSAAQAQDQSESSELQAQKSSDIYCRHLSVKQRGFPLWIPEPNCYLPIQYQRKGTSIGDVGIITAAGSFDYLFNVLLAHDHPFNAGRVPLGFTPLFPPLDPSDIRGQLEFRSNGFIASSSVSRTLGNSDDLGTTFHISASEGAILTIPSGALSEDLSNLVRLRRYMSENVESWYRHANGPRGRELANGDLRLVVGCDKTTVWGMAAFENLSQGEDTRLRFKPVGTAQFQTYGWELQSGTVEVRSGPDAREIQALSTGDAERGGDPRPYENQCIFVRTLNATLHDTVWLELMAQLSVPGESGGSAPSKDVEMSSVASENADDRPLSREGGSFLLSTGLHAGNRPSTADGTIDRVTVHKLGVPACLTSHPSKSLNAAILQHYMDAKMAITDDSDWSSVLTENDILMPKPSHLVERVLENSAFMRDPTGVAYVQKNVAPAPPMPSLRPPTLPPLDWDNLSSVRMRPTAGALPSFLWPMSSTLKVSLVFSPAMHILDSIVFNAKGEMCVEIVTTGSGRTSSTYFRKGDGNLLGEIKWGAKSTILVAGVIDQSVALNQWLPLSSTDDQCRYMYARGCRFTWERQSNKTSFYLRDRAQAHIGSTMLDWGKNSITLELTAEGINHGLSEVCIVAVALLYSNRI